MKFWCGLIVFWCSFVSSASELRHSTQKAIKLLSQIEKPDYLAPAHQACFNPQTSLCDKFQRFKSLGVPEMALKQALLFATKNSDQITHDRYISIADYSQPSWQKRFYILDMKTGILRQEKVSHGSGYQAGKKHGDPDHDGKLNRCHHGENISSRINMTRVGFFRTAQLYYSAKHDRMRNGTREWPYLNKSKKNGMRMHGLSSGVNQEAYGAGVVMHGAWYNDVAAKMGRSYGCPAFSSDVAASVLNQIKEGTLYYSYAPICQELHQKVLEQIAGWEKFCE